ncbi:EAL domain-containing protein [Trichocoleus desertorum AS-A10]
MNSTSKDMVEQQNSVDASQSLTKSNFQLHQVEAEAKLLQTLSLAISESPDLATALQVALQQVCEATGWRYGEAWLPDPTQTRLECSSAWYSESTSLDKFRALSQAIHFQPGVGLPGRVWAKQKPEWIQDVSQEASTSFLRTEIALEAKLKAGLAMPILARGEVVAVLIFFMFEACSEDQRLVELVTAVTAQLGAILQLKRAERALKEQQEFLRLVLDNIPQYIFWKDTQSVYLGCNKSWAELAGLTQPAAAIGKTDDQLPWTPPEIEYYLEQDRRIIATGVPELDIVESKQHQDGRQVWMHVNKLPIHNAEGQVIGLLGLMEDITERKQAEQCLRESEARHRAISGMASDYVYSVRIEPDGELVTEWATEAFYRITDYTLDEINALGGWVSLIHPEDLALTYPFAQQISANQPSILEYRIVNKAGAICWLRDYARPEWDAEQQRVVRILGAVKDITERKQAEEALRQAEAKYRSIFENAVEGIFQTTTNGQYLTANPMLAKIYGYDSSEELMVTLTDIQHQLYVDPSSRAEFMQRIQTQEAVWGFESQIYRKDGTIIWISENARTIRDDQGQLIGYEGTVENISARKQAEAELHKRESLLQGVAEATQHLLTNPNCDAAIAAALATLGTAAGVDRVYIYENHPHPITAEVAMSMRFEWTHEAIAPTIHQSYWQNQPYRESGLGRWYEALSTGQSISGITRDFPLVEQNLLERDQILAILMVPILIDQHFWGYIGFDDCTTERCWSKSEESILIAMAASIGGALKREQAAATIRYQAFHDLLTGLPNRICFNNWLLPSLTQARCSDKNVAVMFLDLDRFKAINDTLGHAVGDQLLQLSAQRIASCLREEDIVARWGGDEFTLLLPDLSCPEDASRIARRVLEALRPAFTLEGHELYITSSIGIALYPQDGEDVPTLLRNADAALYQAKAQGRNNYQFYTAALNAQASARLELESNLHHALERGEFVVYYQPQINLTNQQITCMEALVRWQHPELGLLDPKAFIPLAEENGLIVAIGEWVLRTACQQAKQWHQAGFMRSRVSVNLSARQFQQPELVGIVARTLAETELGPEFLELEITETTVMQNADSTCEVLHDLNKMGVSLAMDDFGAGYSSLGYLKKFPLHTLKIDQSFIRDLSLSPQDAAIVSAVIALGQGLNLNVIAEGVETQAQLERLRSLQCQTIQGYLLSAPLAVSEATVFLRNHRLQCPPPMISQDRVTAQV